MTPRRILILLAVAVVVVGAALWLASAHAPSSTATGAKVLPTLSGSINSVTELHVVAAGGKDAVTLKRDERHWRIAERDGYPADAAKLRKLLLALSELEIVEDKTANPENYARLGVEDPAKADASSVRVDLVGLEKPASLIVGKSAGGDSSYVRVPDAKTSRQAKPMLSVERDPRQWLDRAIVDIGQDRVQSVRIGPAGGKAYEIARENRRQADFAVANLPRGKSLSSSSAANHVAGALASLSLDDVRRAPAAGDASAADWTSNLDSAEFHLFDGTTLKVAGRKDGDKHLIQLSSAFDEAQHRRFVEAAPAVSGTAPAGGATPPVAGTRPGASETAPPLGAAATPTPDAIAAADAAKTAAKDAGPVAAEAQPARSEAAMLEAARQAASAAGARVEGWVYEIPAYKYETLFQPLDDLLSKP